MPDREGRLTPDDVAIVRAFLRGKARLNPHRCPYCDTTEWLMGNHIVTDEIPADLDDLEREDLAGRPVAARVARHAVPYIVFFCTNCAYTMRFNAAMMGFYGDEELPRDTGMGGLPGERNGDA